MIQMLHIGPQCTHVLSSNSGPGKPSHFNLQDSQSRSARRCQKTRMLLTVPVEAYLFQSIDQCNNSWTDDMSRGSACCGFNSQDRTSQVKPSGTAIPRVLVERWSSWIKRKYGTMARNWSDFCSALRKSFALVFLGIKEMIDHSHTWISSPDDSSSSCHFRWSVLPC